MHAVVSWCSSGISIWAAAKARCSWDPCEQGGCDSSEHGIVGCVVPGDIWGFLVVIGDNLSRGKRNPFHSADLRLAIWKIGKTSVPGFSVVKNVDALMGKKTILYVLLLGKKPNQTKHHLTKTHINQSELPCSFIWFIFFPCPSCKDRRGFWVGDWRPWLDSLLSPLSATPTIEEGKFIKIVFLQL